MAVVEVALVAEMAEALEVLLAHERLQEPLKRRAAQRELGRGGGLRRSRERKGRGDEAREETDRVLQVVGSPVNGL
jgi:hypothetical protein